MRPLALLILAAGLLAAGGAGATVDTRGGGKTVGPASGGVGVGVPAGRVRVQCWQEGRKIIDEADLGVVSLGIASQFNGLHLRRNGTGDGAMTVITHARTACLLAPTGVAPSPRDPGPHETPRDPPRDPVRDPASADPPARDGPQGAAPATHETPSHQTSARDFFSRDWRQ